MASLHAYVASADDDGVQVHLYGDAVIRAGARTVEIRTRYPWEGRIAVTVRDSDPAPWTLALRVPAWCTDVTLEVDGAPVTAAAQDGYLRLTRPWRAGAEVVLTLAMPARLIAAHPHVDAVRGTVALLRGPIVYCLEHADLPGVVFEDVELDPAAAITAEPDAPALIPVRLVAGGVRREPESGALYRPLSATGAQPATSMSLTAIPYYLWANRGSGPMRVWLPVARSSIIA
jgi:DUF1680 family protein